MTSRVIRLVFSVFCWDIISLSLTYHFWSVDCANKAVIVYTAEENPANVYSVLMDAQALIRI